MSAQPVVAGRSCGTCTLCCNLPEIDALSKPANEMCSHCIDGQGCTIYPDRPALCRDFHCLWMSDGRLGEEWNPARSHMMLYEQGPQMTVLVDPQFPEIWTQEPYWPTLRSWAEEGRSLGRYVIVFVGDQVTKVG